MHIYFNNWKLNFRVLRVQKGRNDVSDVSPVSRTFLGVHVQNYQKSS